MSRLVFRLIRSLRPPPGVAVGSFGGSFITLFLLLTPPAFAQQNSSGNLPSVVEGRVLDAQSGAPVGWAQVYTRETQRSAVAGGDGRFSLNKLRSGSYTVEAFRIGYETTARRIDVPPGDTLRLTLRLVPSSVALDEVVVRANDEEVSPGRDVSLGGHELRAQLRGTVAETLDDEPGIAMRSMGPAPARPVLRGLGGERLHVLEDGAQTGDLSHSSSDHAVAIEPLMANHMEVLRGPEALRYGPNVLGGVIDVERGYVPTSRPTGVQGEASLQGTSVSRGLAGGVSVATPVGPLAVRADGSLREAQDVHTPAGELDNTALTTESGSLGASYVGGWGYVGGSGSVYRSSYGIPGGFVGAHPSGVSIEMQREHADVRGSYLPAAPALREIEVRGRYNRYQHQEYESNGSLGIEFGVVSFNGAVVAKTDGLGPFGTGAIGLTGEVRDYAAGGYAFTPATLERSVAGFAHQTLLLGPVAVQGGLRFDYRSVTPSRQDTSRLIGVRRARRFGGLSGAISARWEPADGLQVGTRLMRSLRLPGIEELYSEGPHLAAYAFEVGNPELDVERGWGAEVFARYRRPSLSASGALFYNRIADYIFPQNTGEPSRVQLPIFQYTGRSARLVGAEGEAAWTFAEHLTLEGSASYVHGTRVAVGEPLPQIPPLQGRMALRYERDALTLEADATGAAAQRRVGAFEQPTDGYVITGLLAQYHLTAGGPLHTISLGLDNLFDATYRDHLSRVRVIMPEPGRNLTLLYRMHF